MSNNKILSSLSHRLFGRVVLSAKALLVGATLLLGTSAIALAAVVSDVRNTNHNLSASSTGTVKATSETQICVFCHTPHAATSGIQAPLWNRTLSTPTYTPYTSSSMEANAAELAAAPGGSSKLCLSCHDGAMTIGQVNVLNGTGPATIAMAGTAAGKMPAGSGATTGFTRNLGINLSNDHPISFTYDDNGLNTLATADGELRTVPNNDVKNRAAGVKPKFPLENGQMQCATCHDPHIRETDTTLGNRKFLRGNRLQQAAPTGGAYDANNDIMCLSCHDKAGQAWAISAHANPLVDETYLDTAATQREFPANTPVWKAACLNCHDTHTVQGSRRLLREGTDSAASPKSGGNPAIEQTCWQCHSPLGTSIVTPLNHLPDTKSDFSLAYRMPMNNADQGVATEVHDIGTGTGPRAGKDFMESPAKLGFGNPNNRHAECTDCHNPHRVTRTQLFNSNPTSSEPSGTHQHTDSAAMGIHSNIASGALRGTFGVEPVYGSASFFNDPISFTEKRGPVATGASNLVSSTYVTREYQICFKCHSNYAYGTTPPDLGSNGGSTPSGHNGVTKYTNQAREYQAPVAHRGLSGSNTDTGAFKGNTPYTSSYAVDFTINNRRAWHPVMDKTGRSENRGVGGESINMSFNLPWRNAGAIGEQTMYCSDCHGSNTSVESVVPLGGVDGNSWGPHGSSNPFLLKGWFDKCTGSNIEADICRASPLSGPINAVTRPIGATPNLDICFKCHSFNSYGAGIFGPKSGFSGPGNDTYRNLHDLHWNKAGGKMRCTWCHIAVPHGWKNKNFIVNLNDVGPEVMCRQEDANDNRPGYKCTVGLPMPAGMQVRTGDSVGGVSYNPDGTTTGKYWEGRGYTNPPYYMNAVLKIVKFADSGTWENINCGGVGPADSPGNGMQGMCGGGGWANSGYENCTNPP